MLKIDKIRPGVYKWVSIWTMLYQALFWESTKEANDSLEIMCWYKEIADTHKKDFDPQKQTKDKL